MKSGNYQIRKNIWGSKCRYILCDRDGRPLRGLNYLYQAPSGAILNLTIEPEVREFPGSTKLERLQAAFWLYENVVNRSRKKTFGYLYNACEPAASEQQLKDAGAEEILNDFAGRSQPQLTLLMNGLKSGDTLVLCTPDQLGTNLKESAEKIELLAKKGIVIRVLSPGEGFIVDNSVVGEAAVGLLKTMGEVEKELYERYAKGIHSHGTRKKYSDTVIKNVLEMRKIYSYRIVAQKTGVSVSTIQRAERQQKKKEQ